MAPTLRNPLLEVVGDRLRLHFHEGQLRAWESTKRIVAIIAGGRSGKTSMAPAWLHREMQDKGPGDYLVAAPNYPLIDKAAGPEIEQYFGRTCGLGKLNRSPPQQFIFSPKGCVTLWGKTPDRQPRILFGHADEPESLEAMSAKAAWLDEAGQGKFKLGSWEAVQQRLSIDQGRTLITSKPYNLGWLKQLVYDPWVASGENHPEIDVIRFDSRMNPAFPIEEWDRARASLPGWKFDMQYRGLFTHPAGLIYDCFDEATHKVKPFAVPVEWRRHLGLDFGGVNTAGIFLAAEREVSGKETGRLFAYREYKAGSRTAREHKAALLAGEPMLPRCVGGSHSEDQWRNEFAQAGLPVDEAPITEVEVGIDRVYGAFRRGELLVCDHLKGLLEELATYSRELNDRGEPTEKIEAKETYHHLDALRYVISALKTGEGKARLPIAVTGGLGDAPQPTQDTTLGMGRPPQRAGLPFVVGGGIG